MDNAYKGEASIDLGQGDVRKLRYTWSAIMELRAELGEEWEPAINKAMVALDLGALSKIIAIGLRESWPEASSEAVMLRSPPITDATAAVRVALQRAFFGAKSLEEVAAERSANPLRGVARMLIGKIRSWRRSSRLLQPA